MGIDGRSKRTQSFNVERSSTLFRIYRDRAMMFLKISLVVGVGAAVLWLAYVECSAEGRANLGNYAYVSWLHWQTIEEPVRLTIDGTSSKNTPAAYHDGMRDEFYEGKDMLELVRDSLWAGGAGTIACFAALCYFTWKRRPVEDDDEVIRGTGLRNRSAFQKAIHDGVRARSASADAVRRGLRSRFGDPEPPPTDIDASRLEHYFNVGGVEIPRQEEQKHQLILGDSGAGKSTYLRWCMLQIRMRDEPAIIVDREREFIPTFYRPGVDIILNPTDARMPPWTPGLEVETVGEAESLATSLIPGDPNGHNEFFTGTARSAFVDILSIFDPCDPSSIARACALPIADLFKKLEGRPSASALNPAALATAENVRATLQTATRGLGLLPRVDRREDRWTLKAWAEKPKGWIFITSMENEWEATQPLISAWFAILVRHLIDREMDAKPVVHVIVDELATLGRCDKIVDINTRGRKRGMGAILAAQSVSQIEKNYNGSSGSPVVGHKM